MSKILSPWANEAIVKTLTDLWKDHSATEIVDKILETHAVTVSRNAVIGKLHRLGLTVENKTLSHRSTGGAGKPPKPQRTILRFERANANSSAVRLTQSIETDMPNLRCVDIVPLGYSLLDLPDNGCRHPYGGDSDGSAITFCGHPKKEGSSYCVPHHALNWRKVEPRAPKAQIYHGTDFSKGRAA